MLKGILCFICYLALSGCGYQAMQEGRLHQKLLVAQNEQASLETKKHLDAILERIDQLEKNLSQQNNTIESIRSDVRWIRVIALEEGQETDNEKASGEPDESFRFYMARLAKTNKQKRKAAVEEAQKAEDKQPSIGSEKPFSDNARFVEQFLRELRVAEIAEMEERMRKSRQRQSKPGTK